MVENAHVESENTVGENAGMTLVDILVALARLTLKNGTSE